jgi:hypothetical protein
MATDPTNRLSDDELADLARLVDGTLPEQRRAELEARVAASPELTQALAQQALAVDALREAGRRTGAPARLRADVERRRARSARRAPAMRLRGALASGVALVLAAALFLPSILSSGLSVADAAAFAAKPPTAGAPAGVAGTPQLLREDVDGVPFPNYEKKFGWAPVGERRDDRSGHGATTVYYRKAGRTIGYTIVGGDALGQPSDATVSKHGGVTYRTFRHEGRTVVTWRRGGHTCVLSAKAVSASELVALADWRGKGAIPF